MVQVEWNRTWKGSPVVKKLDQNSLKGKVLSLSGRVCGRLLPTVVKHILVIIVSPCFTLCTGMCVIIIHVHTHTHT